MAYRNLPLGTGYTAGPITKAAGGTVNIYVSPTGDDGSGDGSLNRPFATITKAQTVARVVYTGSPVVNLRAGTYYLPSTFNLGLADTGTSSIPVTYKSVDGPGLAHLVGGQVITGWTQYSGSIYRAPLTTPVWTLFEDGVRARLARSPKLNPGVSFPCAFAPYYTALGTEGSQTSFKYNTSDFDPSPWTLADTRIFAWSHTGSAATNWFTDVHGASALNTGTQIFTLQDGGMKFNAMSGGFGARYFVEGPLQLLTEAGEFTCTGGFIYYWPRNPINQVVMVAPTTTKVISITGNSAANCKYITLDGLAIECSDFNSWYRYGTDGVAVEYDYFNTLSQFRMGGIYLENTDHITITNCHIKNTGFAGIFMQGSNQNHTVSNNWIEHTGGSGIEANGPAPGTGDVLKNNTYTNNKIQNFGELDGSASGIRLGQSGGNTISFSYILNGPRRGVWLHGDFGVAAANNYCYSNSVDHVKVQNVMQDSGDAGAVAISFLSAPSPPPAPNPINTLTQVIIDGATAHASMNDIAPSGLYYDNDASGQSATNVNATNIQGTVQHYAAGSSGATFTNCSWVGGFNPALMDTANIGVTGAFPY